MIIITFKLIVTKCISELLNTRNLLNSIYICMKLHKALFSPLFFTFSLIPASLCANINYAIKQRYQNTFAILINRSNCDKWINGVDNEICGLFSLDKTITSASKLTEIVALRHAV